MLENGRQIISTEEISNLPKDLDFELRHKGEDLLPVSGKRHVYEDYIKYLIREKHKTAMVLDKHHKYSCKSDITSNWFMDGKGGYATYECTDKSIRLERDFKIRAELREDGKPYLWMDTKSIFSSKLNVMDLLSRGMDVHGMFVKNVWSAFRQSGVLIEISTKTVVDLQDFGFSLKSFYIEKKKEGYRVENIPDTTPVVMVKLDRGNDTLPYYPQALVPIITREYMSQYDSAFSNRIDSLVKRNMLTRLTVDEGGLTDIGALREIGDPFL